MQDAPRIVVGCCGFATAQTQYFQEFEAIEIQQTFYQPPEPGTAARWREQAPPNFVFCLKAWQLITHPASSPTYRRLRKPLDEQSKKWVGFFQPSDPVFAAWEKTKSIASILQANVVVFQCPASFKPTEENLHNMREFFRRIDRADFILAWEPRGNWPEDVITTLCRELDLVHCVDPFHQNTLFGAVHYYRLHGIGGYRYKYTDEELKKLAERCQRGDRLTFVMFNNTEMLDDARRFRRKLGQI
jgi:uncharacterized protein YecE (DUF72 family)